VLAFCLLGRPSELTLPTYLSGVKSALPHARSSVGFSWIIRTLRIRASDCLVSLSVKLRNSTWHIHTWTSSARLHFRRCSIGCLSEHSTSEPATALVVLFTLLMCTILRVSQRSSPVELARKRQLRVGSNFVLWYSSILLVTCFSSCVFASAISIPTLCFPSYAAFACTHCLSGEAASWAVAFGTLGRLGLSGRSLYGILVRSKAFCHWFGYVQIPRVE